MSKKVICPIMSRGTDIVRCIDGYVEIGFQKELTIIRCAAWNVEDSGCYWFGEEQE